MVCHAPSTKLPAPVILCDDVARQYQLRPIPGQQALDLLAATPSGREAERLEAMADVCAFPAQAAILRRRARQVRERGIL